MLLQSAPSTSADVAPWLTLAGLVIGFVWQGYISARQRRWDREDRQRLIDTAAATLKQGEVNGAKADAAVVRADQLMTKTDEIQTATNGNLTKMRELIAVQLQKIESLEQAVSVAKAASDAAVQAALETQPPPAER